MKQTLLTCLAALAMLPCYAVQQAETYEAAKDLVQEDGYIIFAYAEDWDTFSKKVCDKLMTAEPVIEAAGNAVFMRAPIPNFITEERRKEDKEKFGPLQVGDASSYPALLMLTKSGRLYSVINGSVMRKAAPKKVSRMIRERMDGMKRQEALLARAQEASGVAKAKLLGEACSIPNVSPYDKIGKVINEIKKLDPNNETGYARNLRDPFDFVGEIVGIERDKNRGWEVALQQVETYLGDEKLSPAHQQALHALAVGLLHRHGGLKTAAELHRHTKAIQDLEAKHYAENGGPLSYLAKSAEYADRDWAPGFNLVEGWNPAVMQAADEPLELEGPLPIAKPGTYTISFYFDRGSDAAVIRSVSLYDGQTLVAEDQHDGMAGVKLNNHVYTLKVDAALKDPHLFIKFDQKGKNNSNGHITIQRR